MSLPPNGTAKLLAAAKLQQSVGLLNRADFAACDEFFLQESQVLNGTENCLKATRSVRANFGMWAFEETAASKGSEGLSSPIAAQTVGKRLNTALQT